MSKKTVLVVDDDATLRATIVRSLQEHYSVIEADNGLTGFLKAGAEPRPDLIVSDVEMPRLDGVALVKRLRADPRLSSIPVILLTSRSASQDVVSGIQAGARHYITKPFEAEDLLAKVRKTLR
ncbi:MAG: response regulator [Myxococcales bacterium]|nr:response regulator [Myxococcales bacterium]MDD9968532.1 response regulator [Myxococcales bacterium]